MTSPVEERITDLRQYEDVIAALRLAVEATDDYEKLGRVVEAMLKEAPPTDDDNTGGLEFLLRLQRSGALKFQVGDD